MVVVRVVGVGGGSGGGGGGVVGHLVAVTQGDEVSELLSGQVSHVQLAAVQVREEQTEQSRVRVVQRDLPARETVAASQPQLPQLHIYSFTTTTAS